MIASIGPSDPDCDGRTCHWTQHKARAVRGPFNINAKWAMLLHTYALGVHVQYGFANTSLIQAGTKLFLN